MPEFVEKDMTKGDDQNLRERLKIESPTLYPLLKKGGAAVQSASSLKLWSISN